MSSLTEIYKQLSEGQLDERVGYEAKKRDINNSTSDLISKSHPKSPLVLDFEAELLGLSPEDVKKLPMKAVLLLQQAITHLVSSTKKDPVLRQGLRKLMTLTFDEAEEKSEEEGEKAAVTEEQVMTVYKDFLSTLTEASKATKFNYKPLLDLDPSKLMNPFFVQLVNTFQMERLTRMQKQGMLLFLKKLAELADTNTLIAQALNRIVRLENIASEQGQETPIGESVEKK